MAAPKKTAAKAATTTAVARPSRTAVAMPEDAKAQIAADIARLKEKLAAPSGDGILVTQDKHFKFPDGEKLTEFKGIIIDFVSVNAYYEGKYDPNNIVPPNCFALGNVKNEELVPSDNSPDLQAEHGNCKTCWANAFKSAENGSGKACKQSVKLAILTDTGELQRLGISSTGLKAFGIYVRDVMDSFGTPPYGVMTTFVFDEGSEYASVRCVDPLQLDDEQLAYAFSKRREALDMLMVEPDVSEFEEKVVAARNKPKGRAAATAPAPKGRAATGRRAA